MDAARSSDRRPASRALLALAGFLLTVVGQGLVAGRAHVPDGVLLYALGLGLLLTGLPVPQEGNARSGGQAPALRHYAGYCANDGLFFHFLPFYHLPGHD